MWGSGFRVWGFRDLRVFGFRVGSRGLGGLGSGGAGFRV